MTLTSKLTGAKQQRLAKMAHTDSINWLTVRTSDEAIEPDVFLSD
jgi:hypothetical protein